MPLLINRYVFNAYLKVCVYTRDTDITAMTLSCLLETCSLERDRDINRQLEWSRMCDREKKKQIVTALHGDECHGRKNMGKQSGHLTHPQVAERLPREGDG